MVPDPVISDVWHLGMLHLHKRGRERERARARGMREREIFTCISYWSCTVCHLVMLDIYM